MILFDKDLVSMKKNRREKHTKKIIFNNLSFITLLPSAILLILAVLFLISSLSMQLYFKSEMQKMIGENLQFMSRNLDAVFKSMVNTVSSYSINSDVKKISFNKNYGPNEVSSAANLQKSLLNWRTSENAICMAGLYFSESDLFVSDRATYDNPSENIKSYFTENSIEAFSDIKSMRFLDEKAVVDSSGNVIEVIPMIYPVSPDCSAVIMINTEYLNELIFSDEHNIVEFALLSHDGTVIMTNSTNNQSYISEGESFVSMEHSGNAVPLRYIMRISNETFKEKIGGMVWLTGILTGMFLISSAITFFILRKKVYYPIRNMVTNLELMVPLTSGKSKECSEILLLRRNMDKLFSENYEFKLKESEANNMQNELIVQRILFGIASDEEIDSLNSYDSMFSSYIVLSIFFGRSAGEDMKALRSSMFDGISQAVEAKHLYLNDEKAVRYIIQIKDDGELLALKELLYSMSQHIKASDMFALFCISDRQSGAQYLKKALEHSEILAEMRRTSEEKTVLFYADRENIFASDNKNTEFSLEDEGMLTTWINSGNVRQVEDMLDEQYYAMSSLSFQIFHKRCDYFMKLLLLTISSMNFESSYSEKLEREYYDDIYKSYSAEILWSYVRDAFIKTASMAVNATKKDTKSKILSCIKENISFPLTLQFVAEECGISAQYLSTYFKKEMGINFKTYVDTLKISNAKKQLEQSDMSIQEIALSLGFSESKNFIRVFKKYEGMTPGEYRERSKIIN